MNHLKIKSDISGKVTLELVPTEHSQSIVGDRPNFSAYMADKTNELNYIYPFNLIITEPSDALLEDDTVRFNAPSIHPLYVHEVINLKGAGNMLFPSKEDTEFRHSSAEFSPASWVEALAGIGVEVSLDWFPKEGGITDNDERTYADVEKTFNILKLHDVSTCPGKFYYCLEDMNNVEKYMLDNFHQNPTKYVVNPGNVRKERSPEGQRPAEQVNGSFTDKLVEAYTSIPCESMREVKVRMSRMISKYGTKTNYKNLVLASYQLCAGLDDYDTRVVMDNVESPLARAGMKDLHEHVSRLMGITNYCSNTCQYFYYGKKKEEKMQETLDEFNITKKELAVPYLEMQKYAEVHSIIRREGLQNFFTVEVE